MMVKEVFLRSTLDEMKADKKITHLKELLADNPKTINVGTCCQMESFFIFLKNPAGQLTCAEHMITIFCTVIGFFADSAILAISVPWH